MALFGKTKNKESRADKKKKLKRYGGLKNIPRTTQQTLPWIDVYENGVFQVEPGIFTKTFRFDDISFKTRSDEEQDDIYENYQKFLNTLNPKEDIFFNFVNAKENVKMKLNKISPPMTGDKFDTYRKEIGDMLSEKMKTSRNNIETRKYMTIRVDADSVDSAMARLNTLSGEIDSNFHKVTMESLEPLTLAERLELINDILNSNEENYWFEHDERGGTHIDFDALVGQGLTTKDIVCPEALKFLGGYFEIDGRFGEAMYLDGVANWANSNFLTDLCSVNFECCMSLHIIPIPQEESLKLIHNQSINITSEVMQKQKHAMDNGYSPDFISADLKKAKEQVDSLQEDLMNRDQRLYYMSLTIVHFADTREELKDDSIIIKNTASKYMCTIRPMLMQQERGLASVLPIGIDRGFTKRLMTTESLGVFVPFDEVTQFDEGGIYYGVNAVNKSLIVYNRLKGMNYNGLVLGSSGSGKSFSSKREMSSAFLYTDADIYIIDPDGEYSPIAEAFDGSVIDIAPGNGVYINPLDLDMDTRHDSDLNPMTMKTDFICGLLETMMGTGMMLTPTQRSIVDRCIQIIYRPYLEHLNDLPPDEHGQKRTIDKEHCPTLQNLFDTLLSQPQPEAQNLALVMEAYTTGSFDTFAHRTNVNLDNRLTVYNIKNIGTNLREIALKVCMNDVWNQMVANRRENKWTWFYIDEFHLLLSNPSTSEFLKSVWKRARKWQGVPTGITQNVEDLLNSSEARAIINNSSFIYMLNQSAMDRSMLQNLLKLSDNDMEYITNAESGHGLIYNGKQAIPFADKFPSDTGLYKVMTTKPADDGM